MSSVGRNTSDKVAEIRDYFLGAEKEQLNSLLQNKNNVEKIYKHMQKPLSKTIEQAKFIINAMELGYYKDENGKLVELDDELCEKLEKKLILLMASIDDVEFVRILEKTLDSEDLETNI